LWYTNLAVAVLFSYLTSSNFKDIDPSILDTSPELIDVKTKPTLSPKSLSRDVIRCLGIVTPKQGRADAATPKSHYSALCWKSISDNHNEQHKPAEVTISCACDSCHCKFLKTIKLFPLAVYHAYRHNIASALIRFEPVF